MQRPISTVVLLAAALLAGCGSTNQPVTVAAETTGPPYGVYSPGPGVVVHSDPPSPSPSREVVTWRNCKPDELRENGGCETSFDVDACQASQAAGKFLLDEYINYKDEVAEAALADCPQFLPTWRTAQTGFGDGTHLVPEDVKPGTYQTTGSVKDCYWERNRGGDILANNFISGARSAKVVVQKGDETLVTRGCGNWARN